MSPTQTRPAPQSKGRRDKVRARQAAQRRAQRRRVAVAVAVGVVLVAAVVTGVLLGRGSEVKTVTAVPTAASGSGIALGRSTAPVRVDIYEDFQCPACERFETTTGPTVEQLIASDRIHAVYHQFAFLGPESVRASNAAACAADQDKFQAFHDTLYAHQPAEHSGGYTNSQLLGYGKSVGLTSSQFTSCVNDGRYTSWVRQATDDVSKSGVTATPTVKLNGTVVDASVLASGQAFTAAVDKLAAK